MASITLTPSEKEIQAFIKANQTRITSSNNPYIRYFLRLPQATVSIYTSGKVLLQGEGAEKYASFFGYQVVEENGGQNFPLIGTDEVGNGSYFGGLAVVASFVTPDQHDFLRKLGVGDSKTLTDQKIRQIAPILKEKIQHQALLLSPSKYNEVIGERYNAVSVKVALHNQAIYLLLDLFLENLENLGKELGYQLPSGAGTQSDKVASQILQAYGIQGLNFSAKLHFKNTEKAQKRIER